MSEAALKTPSAGHSRVAGRHLGDQSDGGDSPINRTMDQHRPIPWTNGGELAGCNQPTGWVAQGRWTRKIIVRQTPKVISSGARDDEQSAPVQPRRRRVETGPAPEGPRNPIDIQHGQNVLNSSNNQGVRPGENRGAGKTAHIRKHRPRLQKR